MHKSMRFFTIVLVALVSFGCVGKRPRLNPEDPLFDYKNEFYSQYSRWVTDEDLSALIPLATIGSVDDFVKEFWAIRDTDPRTPQNEFKELIDSRMKDVENGIFMTYREMTGTKFGAEKNLRSDMAHVYLFYGHPSYIARLPEGRTYQELVVWYYIDVQGKPVFRFLFHEDYGFIRLFKEYTSLASIDDLVNTSMSPLRKISRGLVSSSEELNEIWAELEQEDPEWIFRAALLQFSYYQDVVIENGNTTRKIFGALDPPEPAARTASRLKPTILGQPGDISGREFLNNRYYSFIPARSRITEGILSPFTISIRYSDLDWEIKGETAEAILDVRISFQNKGTRDIEELLTSLPIIKSRKEVEEKVKGIAVGNYLVPVTINILLDSVQNFAKVEEPRYTLGQLIDNLEPGTYVVNVDLRHSVTKKSAGGWREEITIK